MEFTFPKSSSCLRILALVTCVSIFSSCERPGGKGGQAPKVASVNVQVANPVIKRVSKWDYFVGRLASPQTVEIRSRVSGFIEKVHFKEGSDVSANQLLFTIDPRPYQAAYDEAVASVDRAKVKLSLAESDAKRAEKLKNSNAIAGEEFDQRLNALAEQQAALREAEAALFAAKLNLEFTEVRSPISGRISHAMLTQGNLISGGNNNADVLSRVIELDPIYSYVEIDENTALKYRELFARVLNAEDASQGVQVNVGLANDTGYPLLGVIDFVDNQLRPETGTIRIRIRIQNPEQALLPGYFVRIQIPGGDPADVALIRDVAVGSDQGAPYVWVVDASGTLQRRSVVVGAMEDGLRVIEKGLESSDRVVVNGMVLARQNAEAQVEQVEMVLHDDKKSGSKVSSSSEKESQRSPQVTSSN